MQAKRLLACYASQAAIQFLDRVNITTSFFHHWQYVAFALSLTSLRSHERSEVSVRCKVSSRRSKKRSMAGPTVSSYCSSIASLTMRLSRASELTKYKTLAIRRCRQAAGASIGAKENTNPASSAHPIACPSPNDSSSASRRASALCYSAPLRCRSGEKSMLVAPSFANKPPLQSTT